MTLPELLTQLRWRPGMGDASVMGWITVAGYGVAAVLCGAAARRAGRLPGSGRRLWLMMTVAMALLCVNKQLDLQSLVTDIGRVMARQQGWYRERREVQKLVVLATLGASCLTATILILRHRKFWRRHALLGTGIILLTTFIVVRAISFHHVDGLLRTRVVGVKMNWVLELTGIAMIGWAAHRARPTWER